MGTPSTAPRARVALALGVLALSVLTASCEGGTHGRSARLAPGALPRLTRVTLILDFIPNAVHAGIYRAIAAGYYHQQNIELRVLEPSSTTETLQLIDAGKADFGLADGADVAEQIDRGDDARAVMAIAQRPLGGLIALASERLAGPCALVGRTVGLTGVPSDRAVLDTELHHAGCLPARVHTVTIGFNGAQDLVAGRIAAFTGFWPDDGVGLQVNGHPVTALKFDQNGGPAYPGLVAFTSERLIDSDPRLVRAFVAATVHGYRDTIADPQRSLRDLLRLNPTIASSLARASLRVYVPLFDDAGRVAFGTLQPAHIAALSAWLARYHLIRSPITVRRYGTDAFLPRR